MEQSTDLIMSWYWSALTALAGLLIGLVADFILQRYVRKLALRTAWEGDELIVKALARKMPLWGLLAGIMAGLPFTPLPVKLMVGLSKAASVTMVLSVTWVCAGVAAGLVGVSTGGVFGGSSTSIFRVLSQVAVWGIGIAVILHQLGISIAPILTALGVGGLAVALALQETLSNLIAGIHIILSQQVRVGDYIKLESGAEGIVTDINWRNTSVRALANNIFVIPNSKLAGAIATNYHLPEPEMSVVIPVAVAYRSDLEQVERVTIEVATEVQQQVQGAIPAFTPFIRYHTFGDNAVGFSVIVRVREFTDQYLVKHEFIKRLHARYHAEGIEIPFPQRTVSFEWESGKVGKWESGTTDN